MFVKADFIEEYLFDILLPLADSPALKYLLKEEDEALGKEMRALVSETASDETMLRQLDDDYADRIIPRATYVQQSQRLRKRIEERRARLSALQGSSVLYKFGGRVQADWETLSAEDQRMIVQALVRRVTIAHILTKPTGARTAAPGGNRFDPSRVKINWRYDVLAKAALGMWDALTPAEQKAAARADWERTTEEAGEPAAYDDTGQPLEITRA